MLMILMYFNPFLFIHWKMSISLITMTLLFFFIPMIFFPSHLSMNMGCDI